MTPRSVVSGTHKGGGGVKDCARESGGGSRTVHTRVVEGSRMVLARAVEWLRAAHDRAVSCLMKAHSCLLIQARTSVAFFPQELKISGEHQSVTHST